MFRVTSHLCGTARGLVCLGFASAATGVGAASCNTSSGSTCTVACSEGTASAVCSSDSKTCSTSCSDSSGNLEKNLAESLLIVSEKSVDPWIVEEFMRYELDI